MTTLHVMATVMVVCVRKYPRMWLVIFPILLYFIIEQRLQIFAGKTLAERNGDIVLAISCGFDNRYYGTRRARTRVLYYTHLRNRTDYRLSALPCVVGQFLIGEVAARESHILPRLLVGNFR